MFKVKVLFLSIILSFSVMAGGKKMVLIKTNKGDIKVELFAEKAPETVKNFLSYVEDKFYDGTIFHRVIDNFMIQGGGFDEKMNQKKTKSPVVNEAKNGLANNEGTLAMARTNEKDSATAQFFINVKDNDFLNHQDEQNYGYAVFGKVIEGMSVVNQIKKVSTHTVGFHQNVPAEAIVIESIRTVE